ncbi:hypothetical protein M3936_14235 [Sutcliffiella horikoshii]|uniref:hypothetical protein n=1 Tax=Sutcliffiella horikoshii TaxID=79883 RepID=UPI00203DCF62|nr:hypothetical protein [Sutcliffiella horikoshii]MCM3618746.1 hypothetical protein [Sutcliffiella horikoshii]
MAKYKVIKVPLNDKNTGKPLKKGDVVERLVKEMDEFEGKYGTEYFERIDKKEDKEEGE